MKQNLLPFLFAFLGVLSTLSAQWSEANFKSSQVTILPSDAFEAGKDGARPYYITKIGFNGATYITKIGKGSTSVSVPNGNNVANLGMIGASNNPFQVYCGDVQWASAGNGNVPGNSVVVPTTGGDVYIAKINAGSTKSTVGWVPVGQSEAQYLDQGKLFRTSDYQLLTGNSVPPPVAVTPQDNPAASRETRRPSGNKPPVVVAPGTQNNGNKPAGNMKTGGVTLVFVSENGNPVSGGDTYVEVTVYNSASRAMVGTYNLSSTQGEMEITNLAPGNYYTNIIANFEENTGNREGWSIPIKLSPSPNPFNFSIRGGMIAMERIMLLKK